MSVCFDNNTVDTLDSKKEKTRFNKSVYLNVKYKHKSKNNIQDSACEKKESVGSNSFKELCE